MLPPNAQESTPKPLTRDFLNVDPHLQVRAVMLLARAAAHCDDDCRLRRIVPYLMVYSWFP